GVARVGVPRRASAALLSAADRRVGVGDRAVRRGAAVARTHRRDRRAGARRRLRRARRASAGESRARGGDYRLLGRGLRLAAGASATAFAHFFSGAWSFRPTRAHFARTCASETGMETLSNLAFGLGVALSWQNVLYCFIGCFLGTLVGVLPGIGPVATVAMLLPFTFGLNPAPALIMLAGIYYGAQYG